MITVERSESLTDACLVAWAKAYQKDNFMFKHLFMLPWMIDMFDSLERDRTEMGEGFYQESIVVMAKEIREGIVRYRNAVPGALHSRFDKPLNTEAPCPQCKGTGWVEPAVSAHVHGSQCYKQDNECLMGYRNECPTHDVECIVCQGLGGVPVELRK